ncbi:MAG: PadR family transcriptional regulator [Chloroflexi bacterium]|nr:MAG: PadR family transcriptional regulator [Chloroflexota bacterium]
MNQPHPLSFLPLREPTFYILISLLPSEKHGYAILKEVEGLSEGRVRLSTGTLYEALARLLDQGLIEHIGGDVSGMEATNPGKPRKHYRLTRTGRRVIEAEAARLQTQVAAALRQMGGSWTETVSSD